MKTTKSKEVKYYEGVGRRKEAVARVRLHLVTKGKGPTVKDVLVKAGEIFIDEKPFSQVYHSPALLKRVLLPIKLTQTDERFAITVHLRGGGQNGQLEAIIHGIARALVKADEQAYKPLLKAHGLMTRDPRTRERRMVGTGGKSRRAKQSPKR